MKRQHQQRNAVLLTAILAAAKYS